MIEENQLILTVGLPYSGKTSVAKSFNCPIVCPDEIRRALHGERYIQAAEPMVWVIAQIMVRALFLAGHSKVVLDATNSTAKRRDEWKDDMWQRRYVVCDVTKVACMARAEQNDDSYILPIIERMAGQLEYAGILYGQESNVNYENPLMEEHIKKPAGTKDDPQIFHSGTAADDV
jgi:predicted kinase